MTSADTKAAAKSRASSEPGGSRWAQLVTEFLEFFDGLFNGTVPRIMGKASRSVEDLQPAFRAKLAAGMAAVKAETGYELYVYETLRTVEEEQAKIDAGLSHLKDPHNSYHVGQPPDGKALAADTWVRGVPFQGPGSEVAVTVAHRAAPIMLRFGLRNIDTPKFQDLLHWQPA